MRLTTYLTAAAVVVSAACETSASHSLGIATSGSGGATQVVFLVQPSAAGAGITIVPAVQVAARNQSGAVDVNYVNGITVSIGTNPAAGVLSGTLTVTPVSGVATFSNLSINHAGVGYTLNAAAPSLTSTTSAAFTITP